MLDTKKKYELFCSVNEDIPVFFKPWWLNAVAEKSWDVRTVEQNGETVAVFPFLYTKKRGVFRLIKMPVLTPYLGVWFNNPYTGNDYKAVSFEKKIIEEIIAQLPAYDYFNIRCHREYTNWLPFYWNGFSQTTRYTYNIPPGRSIEHIKEQFRPNIKRHIKKCEGQLTVEESNNIEEFHRLNSLTFDRKNMQGRSLALLKRIHDACVLNNSGKILLAKNKEGKYIAGVYLVYDKNTVYYLMGGIDPAYKQLGVSSYLMLESIKFAIENDKTFDFEGSMIEPIERFFRSFGGVLKPYMNISQKKSILIKVYEAIKE